MAHGCQKLIGKGCLLPWLSLGWIYNSLELNTGYLVATMVVSMHTMGFIIRRDGVKVSLSTTSFSAAIAIPWV